MVTTVLILVLLPVAYSFIGGAGPVDDHEEMIPQEALANPESTGFISEARLNVALSRARNSLVIVGDAPFWDSGPTKLSEVLEYCRELEPSEFEMERVGR